MQREWMLFAALVAVGSATTLIGTANAAHSESRSAQYVECDDSLAAIEDVDGDGTTDVVLGDPNARSGRGVVWVISGDGSRELSRIQAPPDHEHFGVEVACGPRLMSGPTILVGSIRSESGARLLTLLDAKLGVPIRSIECGASDRGLRAIGSLDRTPEGGTLYATFPSDSGGLHGRGSVAVYSAATGDLLWQRAGEAEGDHLGQAATVIADLDGDRVPDLLVASSPVDWLPVSPGGRVEKRRAYVLAVSGKTGQVLYRIVEANSASGFGDSLCTRSDLDGDGLEDFVVGAPNASGSRPYVSVFSGKSGKELLRVPELAGNRLYGDDVESRFGDAVLCIPDCNGDGIDDLVVGARYGTGLGGAFYFRSGADGAAIGSFVADPLRRNFGTRFALARIAAAPNQCNVFVYSCLDESRGHVHASVISFPDGKQIADFGVDEEDSLIRVPSAK